MEYYLTPWQGLGTEGNPFSPVGRPNGSNSYIDLRANPTSTTGWAILALPTKNDPPGAFYLGDGENSLTPAQRSGIESRLGVTLNSSSLRAIIAQIMNAHPKPPARSWRGRIVAVGDLEIDVDAP